MQQNDTPYQRLSDNVTDIVYREVEYFMCGELQERHCAHQKAALLMARLEFLQNYIDVLAQAPPDDTNPLGYPDPYAKLLFHLELMTQIDEADKDVVALDQFGIRLPDELLAHKKVLADAVDESLNCDTPTSFRHVCATYTTNRTKALFPSLTYTN